MKRIAISFIVAALVVTAGCSKANSGDNGGSNDGGKTVNLTVLSLMSSQVEKDAYTEVVQQFEAQNPNIKVDLQFPGAEYENLMKVRMSSGDLPDIFDTHGWAKVRYGDYLEDLRSEPWASKLLPSIEPYVTDEEGKVYALPLNQSKDGIVYNEDILKQYDIAVPETHAELMDAAREIKERSGGEITPFHFAGLDNYTLGYWFIFMANPLLISPADNFQQDFKDKKFEWSNWTFLPETFAQMHKEGLSNVDLLTAKQSDTTQQFAQGKVAFVVAPPLVLSTARSINPELNAGLMPIPAIVEGDGPSFSGGERNTMGVWKDTPHKDEAKKLLEFVAQTENLKKLSEATSLLPGIQDVEADLYLSPYLDKYKDVRVFPYFDREWLPNGMFDPMCKLGEDLIAGGITPEQYSEKMAEEYERLLKQEQ
ncbi:ABC transporter substrate-binding protein [Cohnella hongkongensis]|uniref:ABC transporter substrate-binding protein n=1 Tax=Cohnella hongkongensis TaxID=178337 RepID=A0ABV9FH04_9BACL